MQDGIARHAASALVLALITLTTALSAQDGRDPRRSGRRELLPKAWEIALARSAAPASVSDSAAVYLFTDTGYVQAEGGKNGAACYVSRSWPKSLEPHCFDSEGAATIMRMEMREVELLHRGTTPDEANREIATDLAGGRFRLPRRPAMSYMMSAGQALISDDGRPVGNWRPHVMIYYPYLESGDLYRGKPDQQAGVVSGSGTARANFTIVVPAFVPVRTGPPPPP